MSHPGATYSQAITYSRGATKVEALLNRLGHVTDRLSEHEMSSDDAKLHVAHLRSGLRVAKRAFEENSRMLDSVDSLINQLY